MNLHWAMESCRRRAAQFLDSVSYEEAGASYYRNSSTHDPHEFPGQLLYGTWSGVFTSVLLQLESLQDESRKAGLAKGLNSFQNPNGFYLQPHIPDACRGGHNDEYLTFHFTNYALGAMRAMGMPPRFPLAFMEQWSSSKALEKWFLSRNWRKPWTEGNNVVNLASFYQVLAEDGCEWAQGRLEEMANWHDANQNAATGFWHSDSGETHEKLHNAMAGAAHNLHIYYYLKRDVPNPEKIVDSCLKLSYNGVRSACIDIDLVDILVHFRRYGYRLQEIERTLECYLIELLQVQNSDGGFSDSYVVPQEVYGHVSPAHASLSWTTWFRLATIGMIACTFLPEERKRWTFRNTVGMGYCNPDFALERAPQAAFSFDPEGIPWAHRSRLALMRNGRYLRQRLTWQARQWLNRSE